MAVCTECGTKFARKSNLKVHINRFHSGLPQNEAAPFSFVPDVVADFAESLAAFENGTLDPSHLVETKEMIKHDTKIYGTKSTKIGFRFSDLAIKISTSGLFFEVSTKYKTLVLLCTVVCSYLGN